MSIKIKTSALNRATETVGEKIAAARAEYATFFDSLAVPSIGRTIAAFTCSFLVGFGFSFLADVVATALTAATLMMTGSAVLSWSVFFLVWAVALAASVYAGAAVGRYVLDRHIDRDFETAKEAVGNAWGWVKSKFSSDTSKVTVH